jgi:hypothetical protein
MIGGQRITPRPHSFTQTGVVVSFDPKIGNILNGLFCAFKVEIAVRYPSTVHVRACHLNKVGFRQPLIGSQCPAVRRRIGRVTGARLAPAVALGRSPESSSRGPGSLWPPLRRVAERPNRRWVRALARDPPSG